MRKGRPTKQNGLSVTERKVQAILAMELPKKKINQKPVSVISVNDLILVLNKFESKIELALYLSKQ